MNRSCWPKLKTKSTPDYKLLPIIFIFLPTGLSNWAGNTVRKRQNVLQDEDKLEEIGGDKDKRIIIIITMKNLWACLFCILCNTFFPVPSTVFSLHQHRIAIIILFCTKIFFFLSSSGATLFVSLFSFCFIFFMDKVKKVKS